MEQAAIISATNGTTRGERSQQPFQNAWAWQVDIGGLRKQWEEEWTTELEKKKREHDLEVKQLKKELLEKSRQFKELEGKVGKIELSIHKWEQGTSELRERM